MAGGRQEARAEQGLSWGPPKPARSVPVSPVITLTRRAAASCASSLSLCTRYTGLPYLSAYLFTAPLLEYKVEFNESRVRKEAARSYKSDRVQGHRGMSHVVLVLEGPHLISLHFPQCITFLTIEWSIEQHVYIPGRGCHRLA